MLHWDHRRIPWYIGCHPYHSKVFDQPLILVHSWLRRTHNFALPVNVTPSNWIRKNERKVNNLNMSSHQCNENQNNHHLHFVSSLDFFSFGYLLWCSFENWCWLTLGRSLLYETKLPIKCHTILGHISIARLFIFVEIMVSATLAAIEITLSFIGPTASSSCR